MMKTETSGFPSPRPQSTDCTTEDEEVEELNTPEDVPFHAERKFTVFESHLIELLNRILCHSCQRTEIVLLQPVVNAVWQMQQTAILSALEEHPGLVVGGDGRCDSPGHSAKYGLYTLIELRCKKIVAMHLVQVSSTC
jgi:solute carrier family 8 (sodium/calcium exchanger)